MAAHPIRVTVERAGTGTESKYVFRSWGVVKPDPDWGLLIGDCVHCARSTLDHLAYQLAILGLGRDLADEEARRVQFPLYENPEAFRGNRGRISDLRRDCQERIEQLQPYHSWDDTIWGPLHMPGPPAPIPAYLRVATDLDNVDKHRLVQPVWITPGISLGPANPGRHGITATSIQDSPLTEGGELGSWQFDHEPPPPPEGDWASYVNFQLSLRAPFFGSRAQRILGNCIMAARMVVDMFEPCILRGAPPAPLRYWDGEPPWL
jgi:hypothetical protein